MLCKWCEVERDIPAVGPHQCDPSNVRAVAFRDARADMVVARWGVRCTHFGDGAQEWLHEGTKPVVYDTLLSAQMAASQAGRQNVSWTYEARPLFLWAPTS